MTDSDERIYESVEEFAASLEADCRQLREVLGDMAQTDEIPPPPPPLLDTREGEEPR